MGELHKSQNLGWKDLAKIIKEMRKSLKIREETSKLKRQILDPEIITKIKTYGYLDSDIEKDIKILNTPVWNLYKLLLAKKEKEIQEEIERSEKLAEEKEAQERKKNLGVLDKVIIGNKEDDKRRTTTMDRMADVFFRMRNDPNYKPRFRKIKYKQKASMTKVDFYRHAEA